MIGNSVSHYTILEKLGEGGIGVVYKARDSNLDRLVAIKFLPFSLTADEQILQQFIHEAKTVSILDHPNICPIYEFDSDDNGRMFMVMPYYDGKTLQDKIVRAHGNVPIRIDEIVTIAIQIAEGLKKAHEQGIIHRDIKPSNIIITKDNGVKILDFGLAKLRNELGKSDPFTRPGTVVYMSPEQCIGDKVDQRSDIWSTGVMLYEMLSGELPFQAEYDQSMIYSILKKEHKPLSMLRSEVPNNLERIVHKSLQKDPDQRYQHMGELLKDLKTLPGIAIKEKAPEKRSLKKRFLVYSIAAIFLISTLLIIYKFYLSLPTDEERKVIAVLPFQNLSSDEEEEYFSEGISEDIRAQLSKISNLKVLSRTSVMKYKQDEMNLPEIAERLNAAAVLEGSVRRSADRIRLVCHLFDAKSEERLWTETYDRQIRDIFEIQSDVAQNIAVALQSVYTPDEKKRVAKKQTQDLSAYEYYLMGRHYLLSYNNRQHNQYAIDLFKKSIKRDPNYALAYIGLADAYVYRGERVRFFSRAWLDSAMIMCNKAVALDPETPDAHRVMGRIYQVKRWFQKAFEEYNKAIELNASDWWALRNIGFIHRKLGSYEQALLYFKKALQIDPTIIQIYNFIGTTYLRIKDYDNARYWYRKAMELKPDSEPYSIAILYMEEGKTEQAMQLFDGIILSNPAQEYNYHDPAIIYQNHGMTQKAIDLLKKALEINPHNGWHYMALAGIYVEQGELDSALVLYKEAIRLVPKYLNLYLHYSFILSRAGIKDEARAILNEISLPPDDWMEPIVQFYQGNLTDTEMEEALKYSFVDVAGQREVGPEQAYYLGMAYLHNLDDNLNGSQKFITKAIEYLHKYHSRANKDDVDLAYTRAELKRLGVFKTKD